MPNIGDTLPCKSKVSIGGGFSKGILKAWVFENAVWKEVYQITVYAGTEFKRCTIGAGRLGDVSGDGVISITDYTMIRLHYLGEHILTADEFYRADVNQDGIVDQADADIVADYITANG